MQTDFHHGLLVPWIFDFLQKSFLVSGECSLSVAGDGVEHISGRLRPPERFGLVIVRIEIVKDGLAKLADAGVRASS